MRLFNWLKINSDASGNTTKPKKDFLNEIHNLLIIETINRHSPDLSKNMVLTVAFRWQEPAGTIRPRDEVIISELIRRNLIRKVSDLDFYQILPSEEEQTQ